MKRLAKIQKPVDNPDRRLRRLVGWLILATLTLVLSLTGKFFYAKMSSLSSSGELELKKGESTMQISAQAFEEGGAIPARHTCDGENARPALRFSDIPAGTATLALVVDDPDAPAGTFVHWLVWNINPQTKTLDEKNLPDGAMEGVTSFGKTGWGGPCPPTGEHRYFFKLYALDAQLDLKSSAKAQELQQAMQGHILDNAQLIGVYKRQT